MPRLEGGAGFVILSGVGWRRQVRRFSQAANSLSAELDSSSGQSLGDPQVTAKTHLVHQSDQVTDNVGITHQGRHRVEQGANRSEGDVTMPEGVLGGCFILGDGGPSTRIGRVLYEAQSRGMDHRSYSCGCDS
jgi:hypothetical protein